MWKEGKGVEDGGSREAIYFWSVPDLVCATSIVSAHGGCADRSKTCDQACRCCNILCAHPREESLEIEKG